MTDLSAFTLSLDSCPESHVNGVLGVFGDWCAEQCDAETYDLHAGLYWLWKEGKQPRPSPPFGKKVHSWDWWDSIGGKWKYATIGKKLYNAIPEYDGPLSNDSDIGSWHGNGGGDPNNGENDSRWTGFPSRSAAILAFARAFAVVEQAEAELREIKKKLKDNDKCEYGTAAHLDCITAHKTPPQPQHHRTDIKCTSCQLKKRQKELQEILKKK
jgi:hypothetical protein